MLQAYSMEEHEYVDEVWGDISEWLDYKKLGGKFVAQAQLDGKIYVYYSKNGATPESTIANAERVTTDITYNPNNTKPYYIDGGTLDASKYTGDTIYNIAGVSGSLVANKDQALVFTDSYNIGYSVSGDPNLLIQADTVLNGKSYNTTTTTIRNALLTISSETTLTAKKELILVGDSNASVTNFGTVKGNVSINNGGTFLNQGTIDGLVALAENASLTNNGAISGDVTVETGASLYGSGTYNGLTTVKSGGLLYVGNSPGYQSHKNLRLADGAILGFCVDGITPATADNNGSGTHSCLSVSGNLTLDGVVTVNVDVTGGIAAAGRTPFTLTLFKIDPDKITVNNNGTLEGKIVSGGDLLEKGASVDWDPEDGELTISGQVTEEAVKAYEQWLREQQAGEGGTGGAYANTLWASTGVLKDFAETAACQLIIGTPGQTTAWGAAIGTFIDHRDFTYNGGGYAVGVQHACTEQFRAGVALGQSFGTYKTDESYLESDQMGIMAAITAQYVLPIVTNRCSWILNGYMGYANVENESKDIYGATGEWDDKAYTIGLRASYLQQIREDFSVSAFAGLEYMYGSQDDIRLSNGALCKDGSMQTWSIPVGVTLRGYMPMGATAMLAPEMSVTYLPIVAQNTPTIHTANGSERGSNTDRNAFIITAGANYLLDANWSMGLFYNVELNSDMVNQSGNLSVRYCF